MAKNIKIWYDKEGDYLEIMFSDNPGFMVETDNDYIMKRIDKEGNILGYSIMGITNINEDNPLYAELLPA